MRAAAEGAGLFDALGSGWLVLDAELLPWSAKAMDLITGQYAAVGAAAGADTVGTGGVLLAGYGLGLAIPFLLCALALQRVLGPMRWVARHHRAVSLVSGGLLILLGVLVASGLARAWWGRPLAVLRRRAAMPIAMAVGAVAFSISTSFGRWILGADYARASRYLRFEYAQRAPNSTKQSPKKPSSAMSTSTPTESTCEDADAGVCVAVPSGCRSTRTW